MKKNKHSKNDIIYTDGNYIYQEYHSIAGFRPYKICIKDRKCKHERIYYTATTSFYNMKVYVCLDCKNYIDVDKGKKRVIGYCESENRVYLAVNVGIIPELYLRKDNMQHIL